MMGGGNSVLSKAVETVSVWESTRCESHGKAKLRVVPTSAAIATYADLAESIWHWVLWGTPLY